MNEAVEAQPKFSIYILSSSSSSETPRPVHSYILRFIFMQACLQSRSVVGGNSK